MKINGHAALTKVLLERAGYKSLSQAIAEMAIFPHPDTVKQTKNNNLFQIIRSASFRGQIENGIMFDDNNSPARAFEWSLAEQLFWKDVQFNHIYSDSKNVKIYTSLANICITPAFLSKLTDTDEVIKHLLKYRSYELYGFCPEGEKTPKRPADYGSLYWHDFPNKVVNLEKVMRSRMFQCLKNRATISAIECGWYFSDYEPDFSLGQVLKKAA